MSTNVYRFEFDQAVPLAEAEAILQLSILACEGLFGPARVRLEARYHLDAAQHSILVDASGDVGAAVMRIFTGLVIRDMGEDAFTVHKPEVASQEAAEGQAA